MLIDRLAPDLMLIDSGFRGAARAIGIYLLLGERPALIETGPASTLEAVLEGIRAAGLDPEALRAVAVTHIHLDHAGAAGALVERCPHLEVYVHPVGAPHLADPARLITSARRLYGETLEPLLGLPTPIPADRVHVLEDRETVLLGSRRLTPLDTPGHARHHLAYWDGNSGDLFTGDVAGVALPGYQCVLPPTPPPELDVEAWLTSLARVRACRAERLLLTHFGAHGWVDGLLDELAERLQAVTALARRAVDGGLDVRALTRRLRELLTAEIADRAGAAVAEQFDLIMPFEQSAMGLFRYVSRTSRKDVSPI